ncbi:MAG: hypothetical protein WBW85_16195, partial [Terriglobales bacterium]
RHHVDVAAKTPRGGDRGCDDREAGVQIMVELVRIDMVGHWNAGPIGQKSDTKLGQDARQIIVVVGAVKRNVSAPFD